MLMRVPVFIVRGEDMGERGAMLKATRIYLEQQKQRYDRERWEKVWCQAHVSSLTVYGCARVYHQAVGAHSRQERTKADKVSSS